MSEPDPVATLTRRAAEVLGWTPVVGAVVAARSHETFVVALVDPRDGRVGAYAKSATLPATDLAAEADAVIRAGTVAPPGTVPDVVGLVEDGGRRILVLRALPGTPLLALVRTRRLAGRGSGRVMATAAAWLASYRSATRRPAPAPTLGSVGWWTSLGGSSEIADELGRIESTGESWSAHGDFWPGNLIVEKDHVGVIDWQHQYDGDQTLADLWWLLLTTAHALPTLRGGWRSTPEAFRAAFLRPGRFATAWTPLVRRHLEDAGIRPELAAAALVASLHRYETLAAERESLGPAAADWRGLAAAVETAAQGSLLHRLRVEMASA